MIQTGSMSRATDISGSAKDSGCWRAATKAAVPPRTQQPRRDQPVIGLNHGELADAVALASRARIEGQLLPA